MLRPEQEFWSFQAGLNVIAPGPGLYRSTLLACWMLDLYLLQKAKDRNVRKSSRGKMRKERKVLFWVVCANYEEEKRFEDQIWSIIRWRVALGWGGISCGGGSCLVYVQRGGGGGYT